jgi:hypothetical protein
MTPPMLERWNVPTRFRARESGRTPRVLLLNLKVLVRALRVAAASRAHATVDVGTFQRSNAPARRRSEVGGAPQKSTRAPLGIAPDIPPIEVSASIDLQSLVGRDQAQAQRSPSTPGGAVLPRVIALTVGPSRRGVYESGGSG